MKRIKKKKSSLSLVSSNSPFRTLCPFSCHFLATVLPESQYLTVPHVTRSLLQLTPETPICNRFYL